MQPACQSADWKRHKKEPCAPLEEMVANDELWHGDIRKGTEMVDVTYSTCLCVFFFVEYLDLTAPPIDRLE